MAEKKQDKDIPDMGGADSAKEEKEGKTANNFSYLLFLM